MASRFHKSHSLAPQLFLSATVATASLAASAMIGSVAAPISGEESWKAAAIADASMAAPPSVTANTKNHRSSSQVPVGDTLQGITF
jgi:hypothetical protein